MKKISTTLNNISNKANIICKVPPLKVGLIGIIMLVPIGMNGAILDTDIADSEAISKADVETIEINQSTKKTPIIDSAKVAKLKSKFREKKDEFQGFTWITHKSAPKYVSANGIYTYFGIKDGEPVTPRLKIQYASSDWLFIESYTFLIDGKIYEFSAPEMERDNDSYIWEWSDSSTNENDETRAIYRALLNAKEAKIRFNGQQYNESRELTPKELQSIVETYEYYKALGGE